MAENGEIEWPDVSEPKKRALLAAYAQTCNMTHAAKAASVPYRTACRWKANDELFRRALLEEATPQAADLLEGEALRRAVKGVRRDVFHQGDKIGEQMVYSDTLLIFLLKAARPAKFRERYEISGPGGGPLRIEAIRASAKAIMGDADSCEVAVQLLDRQVSLAEQGGEQTPAFPMLPGGNGKGKDKGNGNGQEQEK